MPSLGYMNTLAPWAGHLARALLQQALPRRRAHVQGAAARVSGLLTMMGLTDILADPMSSPSP